MAMRIPRLRLDSTGVVILAGLIGALLTVAVVRAFVPSSSRCKIELVETTASTATIHGQIDGVHSVVIWVGNPRVGWMLPGDGPGTLEVNLEVPPGQSQLKYTIACRSWNNTSSTSSGLQMDGKLVMRPQGHVTPSAGGFAFADYEYPDGRIVPVGCSLSTDLSIMSPNEAN